jgi:hypothetical protein
MLIDQVSQRESPSALGSFGRLNQTAYSLSMLFMRDVTGGDIVGWMTIGSPGESGSGIRWPGAAALRTATLEAGTVMIP